MPGTMPARSAAIADDGLDQPAAASRWPKAHLKPVTGGIVAAEHAQQRARFGARRSSRVPLPCATIMPTSAGATAADRPVRASIARTRPSPSSRTGSRPEPVAAAAGAQNFAEHGGAALARGGFRFERRAQRRLRPSRCRHGATSNGRSAGARQQAHLVVVQQRLRLDRRHRARRPRRASHSPARSASAASASASRPLML